MRAVSTSNYSFYLNPKKSKYQNTFSYTQYDFKNRINKAYFNFKLTSVCFSSGKYSFETWLTGLDKINSNCKCYFKSDMLLVPLTLLTPPTPSVHFYSLQAGLANSLQSFASCSPTHSEIQSIPALTSAGRLWRIHILGRKNITSSPVIQLWHTRLCFFSCPPTVILTISNNKISLFGLPSPQNFIFKYF